MKVFVALAAALAALPSAAQEIEIQRSVIQRDQQSAEFAARVRGADTAALQQLHARQLTEVMTIPVQTELRPNQRQTMANERVLVLPPPPMLVKQPEKPASSSPLPLPGGPKHGVDPIPVESSRN
jgi:hypothetical protein